MAKKKINIILLLFVLGVWGTVLYRYVNQLLYKQEAISVDQDKKFSLANKIQNKDTFEMAEIRRDPFLDKSFIVSEKKMSSHVPRKIVSSKKEVVVKSKYFPIIEYYGYIKSNNQGKSELVLIKNNGALMKLKLGEDREGLKILKVFKDSVQVSYDKDIRYIRRSK